MDNPIITDALGQAKAAIESLRACVVEAYPRLAVPPTPGCQCPDCARLKRAHAALTQADAADEAIQSALLEFTTFELPVETTP